MCNQCIPGAVLSHANGGDKEAFANKLMEMMNHAAAVLMISVGHRTRLFDAMAEMEPATSEEIAAAAGLNERYVREWLGAMTTSGVTLYNRVDDTYYLPPAHASLTTREAGADNIATLAQYIPVLGSVEDRIVECFERGGGVPYSAYPRFHTVMADDSGQSVLPALTTHILPLVPGIMEKMEKGIRALDVGCGKGRALIRMARRFPNSRFVGYDISEEAIESARREAAEYGLKNIEFKIQDAAAMTETAEYDFIVTFDSIHDQAKPQTVLNNIHRALRPDGAYLMQDIDVHSNVGDNLEHPVGTLIYTISCMHCMSVSLAEGGDGLGAAWGVELAQSMLREAGFRSTGIERLPHDIQNCFYINYP